MKSFVVINVLAGLAHYLFQVVAAKKLDASSFSSFSAWLAYLAVAFTLSSVLHYLSCFIPLPRAKLKLLLAVAAVPAVIVCLLPLLEGLDLLVLGACAAVMACLFGFLSGQAQARLHFTAMASAGALAGLAKLSVVLLPIAGVLSVGHFAWAIVCSYVPGLLLLTFVLMRSAHSLSSTPPSRTFHIALVSTLLLSSANAFFPQFELLMMKETQTTMVFEQFARLSLFYKAIFFGFMIIGQWLLPFQLRGEGRPTKALADARMLLMAMGLAGAAALVGPSLSQVLLGWQKPPSALNIFLSCLNMSCLTWLFLLLQGLCAKQNLKGAAMIWLGVFVVVPAQLTLELSVTHYYYLAIVLNLLLIAMAITCSGVRLPKPSSPSNGA